MKPLLYQILFYVISIFIQTTLILVLTTFAARYERHNPAREHLLLTIGMAAGSLVPVLCGGVLITNFPCVQLFSPMFDSISGIVLCWGILLVLILWITGTIYQVVRFVVGILDSRRLMYSARPLVNPESHGRLEKCLTTFENGSHPVLLTLNRIRRPSIWCWGLHPAILLPEEFKDSLSGEETEAIFFHELAHLIRRDHLSGLICNLSDILLFWHPFYRSMRRRLDTLADEACDLFVLGRSEISPKFYLEILLRMASDERNQSAYHFFAQKESIMKRVSTILDVQDQKVILKQTMPGRFWSGATVLIAMFICLSLSICLTFRASEAVGSNEVKTESQKTICTQNSTQDPKFTDEYLTSCKKRYQSISAQCKVGHPNGTLYNLAVATIDYYEAKILTIPQDKQPDPNDIKCLLEQAEKLSNITRAMLDAGLITAQEREKNEVRSLELQKTYAPILNELLADSNLEEQNGIVCHKIDLPLYVFPTVENLSTPENAYASFERGVICQQDEVKAMEYFKHVSIPFWNNNINIKISEFQYDPDRANLCGKMEIIEVYQYGEHCACVIVQIHKVGIERPIDVRLFDCIDGKWLSAGNKRYNTIEQAKESFLISVKKLQTEGMETFSELHEITESEQKKNIANGLDIIRKRNDVVITPINRPVSNFSVDMKKAEKPEDVYAALAIIFSTDDPAVLDRYGNFSRLHNGKIMSEEERQYFLNAPKDWKETLRGASIIETYTCGDVAVIVGFLPGENIRKRYDSRCVEYDKEKKCWFNVGNERYDSKEEALAHFGYLLMRKER